MAGRLVPSKGTGAPQRHVPALFQSIGRSLASLGERIGIFQANRESRLAAGQAKAAKALMRELAKGDDASGRKLLGCTAKLLEQSKKRYDNLDRAVESAFTFVANAGYPMPSRDVIQAGHKTVLAQLSDREIQRKNLDQDLTNSIGWAKPDPADRFNALKEGIQLLFFELKQASPPEHAMQVGKSLPKRVQCAPLEPQFHAEAQPYGEVDLQANAEPLEKFAQPGYLLAADAEPTWDADMLIAQELDSADPSMNKLDLDELLAELEKPSAPTKPE